MKSGFYSYLRRSVLDGGRARGGGGRYHGCSGHGGRYTLFKTNRFAHGVGQLGTGEGSNPTLSLSHRRLSGRPRQLSIRQSTLNPATESTRPGGGAIPMESTRRLLLLAGWMGTTVRTEGAGLAWAGLAWPGQAWAKESAHIGRARRIASQKQAAAAVAKPSQTA